MIRNTFAGFALMALVPVSMAAKPGTSTPPPPPPPPPAITRTVTVAPNPAGLNETVTISYTSSDDVGKDVSFQIGKFGYVAGTVPSPPADNAFDTIDGSVVYETAGVTINKDFSPIGIPVNGDNTRDLVPGMCYFVRTKTTGAGNGTYNSPAAPLCIKEAVVVDPCDGKKDLDISAALVQGEGTVVNGTASTWTYGITVKACKEIVQGTKVQGGNVAWANQICNNELTGSPNISITAGTFTCSNKAKNTVITWLLPPLMKGDSLTLKSTQSGTAKIAIQAIYPEGTGPGLPLNGPWSAVYQTVEEATASPVIPAHKTDYTDRVMILITP